MPVTSKAQLRAMAAAANGKSTLGIPKAVGKEFVRATPKGAALPARAPHPGSEPLPKAHTSQHH